MEGWRRDDIEASRRVVEAHILVPGEIEGTGWTRQWTDERNVGSTCTEVRGQERELEGGNP